MADHSKPSQYDSKSPGGLNNALIGMVGLISIALFVVIVVALEAWFFNETDSLEEEGYRRGNPRVEAHFAEEASRLNRLTRRADNPNLATVPLDFAIERFVESQSK